MVVEGCLVVVVVVVVVDVDYFVDCVGVVLDFVVWVGDWLVGGVGLGGEVMYLVLFWVGD